MNKLLKAMVILFSVFLGYNAIALIFGLTAIKGFSYDASLLVEYRSRVLVPTLYFTIIYFVFRYFAGKNPTSTIWPVYVVLCSWLVCNLSAFVWIKDLNPLLLAILLNVVMLIVTRIAHNKRKNEIF
jgi:hypothetical protein